MDTNNKKISSGCSIWAGYKISYIHDKNNIKHLAEKCMNLYAVDEVSLMNGVYDYFFTICKERNIDIDSIFTNKPAIHNGQELGIQAFYGNKNNDGTILKYSKNFNGLEISFFMSRHIQKSIEITNESGYLDDIALKIKAFCVVN